MISRELRRNNVPTKVWPGGNDPVRADELAWRRRRWDKRFKLARQPDLRDLVRDRLAMGMSPEQIAGRLAREHGRTLVITGIASCLVASRVEAISASGAALSRG